jgi:hypothetical protein
MKEEPKTKNMHDYADDKEVLVAAGIDPEEFKLIYYIPPDSTKGIEYKGERITAQRMGLLLLKRQFEETALTTKAIDDLTEQVGKLTEVVGMLPSRFKPLAVQRIPGYKKVIRAIKHFFV